MSVTLKINSMNGLRLLQLAKDLYVSIDTVVASLAAKGIFVENKPTTKLSIEEVNIAIATIASDAPKLQELLTKYTHNPTSNATTFTKLEFIRNLKGKPKSFFKFFGTQNYNISCLTDGYIYLSAPNSFNDPFDCSLQLINLDYKNQKNFNKKSVDRFRERLEEIGVCCFSRTNDSILMWAHYANSHRGFCCEFTSDDNNSEGLHPLDVCYANNFKKLDFHFNADDAIANMIYTKSDCWSYEEELRILKHGLSKPEDRKKKYAQKDLKSVFLGVSCEAKIVNTIKVCLREKYPNAKLYKAYKSPSEFKILFEEVQVQ